MKTCNFKGLFRLRGLKSWAWWNRLKNIPARIYIGRHPGSLPPNAIVFFPVQPALLGCGLAGIVAIRRPAPRETDRQPPELLVLKTPPPCDIDPGPKSLEALSAYFQEVRALKRDAPFYHICTHTKLQDGLKALIARMQDCLAAAEKHLTQHQGFLEDHQVERLTLYTDIQKDIIWCLQRELLDNIGKIRQFLPQDEQTSWSFGQVALFKHINAVLNSIDRLEVRGRDSAGLSLMFVMTPPVYAQFREQLKQDGEDRRFSQRTQNDVLLNQGIRIHENHMQDKAGHTAVNLTYKVAAEIGGLGDNVAYLRRQIGSDPILAILGGLPVSFCTVSAHTRWASVGAISEANCHPMDNHGGQLADSAGGIIMASLNGDIDNYLELKEAYEKTHGPICADISTDTKIIPLLIDAHVREGHGIQEAFRLALNRFEGSHAIAMQSDLAPGKLFLAQRGSGQAIFIGLAPDHYITASEIYGLVEETPAYLTVEGERSLETANGTTQGQIFVLDASSAGGLEGIAAMYYDGTPVKLDNEDIKQTHITSRDIDRQEYAHYFLKEISEAPASVEKTLLNRWRIGEDGQNRTVFLTHQVVPEKIRAALLQNLIRRIYFVGQGTAGVAAQACADILAYYLEDADIQVSALKASELSGFKLCGQGENQVMGDTLVIAITQSGTTTDTNRAVDMVRERGAHTLAIVNRRDSHITFKVDGVMYTSSGRDIEMSVASTKAFYSQIVAGALLSLFFAAIKKRRSAEFIDAEVQSLTRLPASMRQVLDIKADIAASARRLAPLRTYWAAVGSGPNKAAADEIRIKLSELCYKTISSDYVEDKKHIDLSSEPLIIVCAAGTRGTVIGDIVKDTAIFKAHKAAPVVITDQGETRFAPWAEDVFQVPTVSEHLAVVLNTLVGHIWGYYAALAINATSRFLYDFRQDLQTTIDQYTTKGMDVYEIILEKTFREKIARFYTDFRRKGADEGFHGIMGVAAASDLTLLLKYLSGRLPILDFELDFGVKGTALNMLNLLFKCLGEVINETARPVDAIKHQAKTVTVGTSRIQEKVEGLLFETLAAHHFAVSQLIPRNVIVLKNLQGVVRDIQGSVLYRIAGLGLLGSPEANTTIDVVRKEGVAANLTSRIEKDNRLTGSKRIIVRQGNVYIGRGRKDGRSILVIPLISNAPSTPNIIEHLLLLHIQIKEQIPLDLKIKALGGKYEHIQNIVQENSVKWDDTYLERIDNADLFGWSAEKIGEKIVSLVSA